MVGVLLPLLKAPNLLMLPLLLMLLSRHGFLIQEASFHVTSDRSQLVACKPINDDASVQTADGTSCHINHQGCLSSSNFSVPNVSFVPK